MAKKVDLKGALTLGSKKKIIKKTEKNLDQLEAATKYIHDEPVETKPAKAAPKAASKASPAPKAAKKPAKRATKKVTKVEPTTRKVGRPAKDEDVKKTSLHIPMDLYKKMKIRSFEEGVTLRDLIITTLQKKLG